jgi:hypothetical protein
VLFPEVRYFFYLTNDRDLTAAEVVFEANARCDQEVRHDNREGIADSVSRTLGRRCLSRPTYSPSKDERGTEPVGEAAVGVEVPGPTRRKACEAW